MWVQSELRGAESVIIQHLVKVQYKKVQIISLMIFILIICSNYNPLDVLGYINHININFNYLFLPFKMWLLEN